MTFASKTLEPKIEKDQIHDLFWLHLHQDLDEASYDDRPLNHRGQDRLVLGVQHGDLDA
jgi:hypothetical protein